ncbi:MAG: GNAT family N-acetyltransferase [Lachnospiraceae bacterium]|nr:GNAT family N-acetyltransferase [Lachnospiraceae bacterium]
MISLVENDITIEEYKYLRSKVGWNMLSDKQSESALSNSIYNVKALDDDGNIIGMGRIVGDGAVICYIQDLIVVPEAQGKRVGSMIIDRLIEYVKSIKEDGTTMMLCLMCAKGREPFYEKHDFIARPTSDLGPGMIQYIR